MPSRGVFAQIAELTRGHRKEAAWLALIGLLFAAWDAGVPLLNAAILGMVIAHYPVEPVVAAFSLVFLFGWIPHGSLIPLLLEAYDLRCFRLRLQRTISERIVRRAAAAPTCAGKQPTVQQGRDNLVGLSDRVVRDLPQMLRTVAILCATLFVSPWFAVWLATCGVVTVGLCMLQYRRLAPFYLLRQQAEDIQRDYENTLLPLPPELAVQQVEGYLLVLDVRLDLERDARTRDLVYKFWRDTAFSLTLASVMVFGIYWTLVLHQPPETLTVVLSYGGKANELFASVANLQNELVRIRPSVENLDKMAEGLQTGRASQ